MVVVLDDFAMRAMHMIMGVAINSERVSYVLAKERNEIRIAQNGLWASHATHMVIETNHFVRLRHDEMQVMTDQEHAAMVAIADLADQAVEFGLAGDIDARKRLIQDEKLRAPDQCPREHDPAQLAARKLCELSMEQIFDRECFEGLRDLTVWKVSGETDETCGRQRHGAVALQSLRDIADPQPRSPDDVACLRLHKAKQRARERRLARAIESDDGQDFLGPDQNVHMVEHKAFVQIDADGLRLDERRFQRRRRRELRFVGQGSAHASNGVIGVSRWNANGSNRLSDAALAAMIASRSGSFTVSIRLFFLFALLVSSADIRSACAVERLSTYLPAEPSSLAARRLVLDIAYASERIVAVGIFGHVLLSDNYGESFRQADYVPTQATLTAVSFADSRHGWAVGHDATIIATSDGGQTWSVQYSDLEFGNPLFTVHFFDLQNGIAMGAYGLVLETANGGRRWTRRALRPADVSDLHLNKIVSVNDSLYVASEFGTVYRSIDRGRTFASVQSPTTESFWNALALPGGGVVFMGDDGAAWKTDATLKSWTQLTAPADIRFAGATLVNGSALTLVGATRNGDGVIAYAMQDGALTLQLERGVGGFATAVPGQRGKLVIGGENGLRLVADHP